MLSHTAELSYSITAIAVKSLVSFVSDLQRGAWKGNFIDGKILTMNS